MSAFEKWFQINFRENVTEGAQHLFECCRDGGSDSVAWDWLDKTGDKQFSNETFIKAAKLILEEK